MAIEEGAAITALEALELRIRAVCEAYCACLDDADFEKWPTFFTEDCIYRVQSAENHARGLEHAPIYCDGIGMVRDRVSATKVMQYEPRRQRRFVSNLRILGVGEYIRSSMSFMLTEAMLDRDPVLAMTGQYLDEFVVTENGLKLRSRVCLYDNYRIVQNLIFPL